MRLKLILAGLLLATAPAWAAPKPRSTRRRGVTPSTSSSPSSGSTTSPALRNSPPSSATSAGTTSSPTAPRRLSTPTSSSRRDVSAMPSVPQSMAWLLAREITSMPAFSHTGTTIPFSCAAVARS